MPRMKTTIVVGAGASVEAGLPTGGGLMEKIEESLHFAPKHSQAARGDHTIFRALQFEPSSSECFHAAERIRKALPQASSIDEYINNHRGNEEIERCGKLAIVKSILEAEKRSRLYIDPSNIYNELDFAKVKDTWFNGFWKQVTKDCQAEDLAERFSSIALIVFNYDRCLEHYLYHSIQNYYGLRQEVAAELVNSIEIFHPYGTVGSLPWNGGPAQVAFGAEPNFQELGVLANEIKTFSEGTEPSSSDVAIIKNRVATADRLIFLGFAYHRQNMALLMGYEGFPRNENIGCWGTAHGISEADRGMIEQELLKIDGAASVAVEIGDLECRKLFETYTRALSFV